MRRYTLIKKKKTGTDNKPKKGDIFIDVELFALDSEYSVLFTKVVGRLKILFWEVYLTSLI
jgi:hypothetical protein